MKYTFLLGCTLLLACHRQDAPKPETANSLFVAAYTKYGLREATPYVSKLRSALEGHNIYQRITSKLDFSRVQMLTSRRKKILIFIIETKESDQLYAVKAVKSKVLVVQSEVLLTARMENDRNGVIGILKDGEGLLIDVTDGERTIQAISDGEYKIQFVQEDPDLAQLGFCQREKNQKFSDCFKHETDEFCDSFWSCVALNTNPHVVVLIALACGCTAGSDVPADLRLLSPGGSDTSRMIDTLPKPEPPLIEL